MEYMNCIAVLQAKLHNPRADSLCVYSVTVWGYGTIPLLTVGYCEASVPLPQKGYILVCEFVSNEYSNFFFTT